MKTETSAERLMKKEIVQRSHTSELPEEPRGIVDGLREAVLAQREPDCGSVDGDDWQAQLQLIRNLHHGEIRTTLYDGVRSSIRVAPCQTPDHGFARVCGNVRDVCGAATLEAVKVLDLETNLLEELDNVEVA